MHRCYFVSLKRNLDEKIDDCRDLRSGYTYFISLPRIPVVRAIGPCKGFRVHSGRRVCTMKQPKRNVMNALATLRHVRVRFYRIGLLIPLFYALCSQTLLYIGYGNLSCKLEKGFPDCLTSECFLCASR